MRKKTGCLQTTYNIHNNAIRVDAEKLGQGMKPAYSNDPTVRAAYVAGDGVRNVETRVNKSSVTGTCEK